MSIPRSGAVDVYVEGQSGYVWDPEGVVHIRRELRLLGMLVGGVSEYPNQNAVSGLPLNLNADEVTLGLEKGWFNVLRATQRRDTLEISAEDRDAQCQREPTVDHYDDYYAYYSDEPPSTPHIVPSTVESQSLPCSTATERNTELPWHKTVCEGTSFEIPLTAVQAAECNAASVYVGEQPVVWTYPESKEDKMRYAVFKDLHAKGFYLSEGTKFGADLLAYPADPCLVHAQFTVRIFPPDRPLAPLQLMAAARGSHAARKHMLLVTINKVDCETKTSNNIELSYYTMAPEAGFGKAKH